jgi:hypothetical protein
MVTILMKTRMHIMEAKGSVVRLKWDLVIEVDQQVDKMLTHKAMFLHSKTWASLQVSKLWSLISKMFKKSFENVN